MHVVASTAERIDAETASIMEFMTGFTVETTPASAAKIADFRAIICPETVVYITFLPGSDYLDTVATAKRLRDEGFRPAPHFAARSIRSKAEFEDYLARITGEASVNHVLAIAGAGSSQVGPYADSMQLLDSGMFDRYGIKTIGVAGHPEGSPDMSDEAILDALRWKNAFAERTDADLQLVTQFCFEAKPIIAWDRMLNAEGNRLPIRIGIPGIAKLSTLINFATSCGVGNSIRFLRKRAADLTRMLRPQAPDRLVRDLAAYAANNPNCGIAGVHMYPLGGLKKSALWSYSVTDGTIALKQDGGFDVFVDIG